VAGGEEKPPFVKGALAGTALNSSSERKSSEFVQRGWRQKKAPFRKGGWGISPTFPPQTKIRQSLRSIRMTKGMGDGALTASRPQIIQYPRQVGGQLGPELQRFSGSGMLEPQQISVQKVPV